MRSRSRVWRLGALLLALALALTACNQGMPGQAGQYQLQAHSLSWDGQQYRFAWVDASGGLHWASGDDVQLVQDQRSYLEMKDGHPVVHLTPEDPVTVLGRDRNGDYSSPWFPFLAGAALGNALGGRNQPVVISQPYPGTPDVPPTRPAYRYPPTDSFGRDDSLHGSVTNTRPAAPDYTQVRPIPDAVSGQSGGAGGGTAASNKAPSVSSGQAGGSGSGSAATTKSSAPESGQAGGTGTGSAASSKGSFRASGGGSSAPSIGGGSSKAPSSGTSGAKSSGGFSGGKSSGGFSGGRSGGKR